MFWTFSRSLYRLSQVWSLWVHGVVLLLSKSQTPPVPFLEYTNNEWMPYEKTWKYLNSFHFTYSKNTEQFLNISFMDCGTQNREFSVEGAVLISPWGPVPKSWKAGIIMWQIDISSVWALMGEVLLGKWMHLQQNNSRWLERPLHLFTVNKNVDRVCVVFRPRIFKILYCYYCYSFATRKLDWTAQILPVSGGATKAADANCR